MNYVPENQRDTAWYIFNYQFLCRVNANQTRSIEHLRFFGMPTCGNERLDKEVANELMLTMLTINQMVEYHKSGISIGIVNHADSKMIYEFISNHLNFWKKNLENSLHVRNAPLEDLRLLDTFAGLVYEYAAPQFNTEHVDSMLARKLSTTLRVNRDNILKPKTIVNPNEPVPIKERVSMADSFALSRETTKLTSAKWR